MKSWKDKLIALSQVPIMMFSYAFELVNEALNNEEESNEV